MALQRLSGLSPSSGSPSVVSRASQRRSGLSAPLRSLGLFRSQRVQVSACAGLICCRKHVISCSCLFLVTVKTFKSKNRIHKIHKIHRAHILGTTTQNLDKTALLFSLSSTSFVSAHSPCGEYGTTDRNSALALQQRCVSLTQHHRTRRPPAHLIHTTGI